MHDAGRPKQQAASCRQAAGLIHLRLPLPQPPPQQQQRSCTAGAAGATAALLPLLPDPSWGRLCDGLMPWPSWRLAAPPPRGAAGRVWSSWPRIAPSLHSRERPQATHAQHVHMLSSWTGCLHEPGMDSRASPSTSHLPGSKSGAPGAAVAHLQPLEPPCHWVSGLPSVGPTPQSPHDDPLALGGHRRTQALHTYADPNPPSSRYHPPASASRPQIVCSPSPLSLPRLPCSHFAFFAKLL
jgi:hypothetical protein